MATPKASQAPIPAAPALPSIIVTPSTQVQPTATQGRKEVLQASQPSLTQARKRTHAEAKPPPTPPLKPLPYDSSNAFSSTKQQLLKSDAPIECPACQQLVATSLAFAHLETTCPSRPAQPAKSMPTFETNGKPFELKTPARAKGSKDGEGKDIKGFLMSKAVATDDTGTKKKKKRKTGSSKTQSTISFGGKKETPRQPLQNIDGNADKSVAKTEVGKRKRRQPSEDPEIERAKAESLEFARADKEARRARLKEYQGVAEDEDEEMAEAGHAGAVEMDATGIRADSADIEADLVSGEEDGEADDAMTAVPIYEFDPLVSSFTTPRPRAQRRAEREAKRRRELRREVEAQVKRECFNELMANVDELNRQSAETFMAESKKELEEQVREEIRAELSAEFQKQRSKMEDEQKTLKNELEHQRAALGSETANLRRDFERKYKSIEIEKQGLVVEKLVLVAENARLKEEVGKSKLQAQAALDASAKQREEPPSEQQTPHEMFEAFRELRHEGDFLRAVFDKYRRMDATDRQVEANRQLAQTRALEREEKARQAKIQSEIDNPPDELYAMTESIMDGNVPASSFYCARLMEERGFKPSRVAETLVRLAPRCVGLVKDTRESFTALVANTLSIANTTTGSTAALLVTQTVVKMAEADKTEFYTKGYAEIKEAMNEQGVKGEPVPELLIEYTEEDTERKRFFGAGGEDAIIVPESDEYYALQNMRMSYLPGHLGSRSFMEEPEMYMEN